MSIIMNYSIFCSVFITKEYCCLSVEPILDILQRGSIVYVFLNVKSSQITVMW